MTTDENVNHPLAGTHTRWEYQVFVIAESQLQDKLNTYGVFGWELASITPAITPGYFILILKMSYQFQEQIENNEW